jgi:hypothetical protein
MWWNPAAFELCEVPVRVLGRGSVAEPPEPHILDSNSRLDPREHYSAAASRPSLRWRCVGRAGTARTRG